MGFNSGFKGLIHLNVWRCADLQALYLVNFSCTVSNITSLQTGEHSFSTQQSLLLLSLTTHSPTQTRWLLSKAAGSIQQSANLPVRSSSDQPLCQYRYTDNWQGANEQIPVSLHRHTVYHGSLLYKTDNYRCQIGVGLWLIRRYYLSGTQRIGYRERARNKTSII